MNKQKEKVIKNLEEIRDKAVKGEILGLEEITQITEAIKYVSCTPCTYDKDTVCQAIACHSCLKCDEDFDKNNQMCRDKFFEAEMLYERMILEEHDEEQNS